MVAVPGIPRLILPRRGGRTKQEVFLGFFIYPPPQVGGGGEEGDSYRSLRYAGP